MEPLVRQTRRLFNAYQTRISGEFTSLVQLSRIADAVAALEPLDGTDSDFPIYSLLFKSYKAPSLPG